MPRYQIINASDGVFNRPTGKGGDGMVQPNTERVLELDEELSDSFIEREAAGGVFIKKTNAAAQNGQPLPGLNENIALARPRLMVAAGQERDDIIAELRGEKKSKASTSSAKDASSDTATSAAPSAAPTPSAPTAAASAGAPSTGAR